MNKLELIRFKKKLLTSALITTTTLETFFPKDVKAIYYEMEEVPALCDIVNTETTESIEELIKYYSNVYGLNSEKVYDIIYDMTNGFDNYAWYTFNLADGQIYDRKENAIIAITRDIYSNPSKYGFKKSSEIRVKIEETDLSFEKLVEKHAELQNINKVIPATIGHVECGDRMQSNLYTNHNNCGGFRSNKGWMSFPSKEAGVIYLVTLLKNSYGCTMESDKSFFSKVSQKYCPDNPGHWISLANPFYNNISKDYYHYSNDTYEDNIQRRLVIKSN